MLKHVFKMYCGNTITFTSTLTTGDTYDISLAVSPSGAQNCTLTGNSGTIEHVDITATASCANNWILADAGTNHSLAIRGDGSLWAWGDNSFGQLGDGTTALQRSPVQIP